MSMDAAGEQQCGLLAQHPRGNIIWSGVIRLRLDQNEPRLVGSGTYSSPTQARQRLLINQETERRFDRKSMAQNMMIYQGIDSSNGR